MRRKLLITFFILVLVFIVGGKFMLTQWQNGYLETVKPKRGVAIEAVYATGEVESVNWAQVSAEMPGKVIDILVKEGGEVNKGQILAQLDDDIDLAKAKELEARLFYLMKEKQRYQNLMERDHTSQRTVDKVVSEYETVKAQLEAQKELLKHLKITSPLKGSILKEDVDIGEYIQRGQVVFWVGQLKPLRITAEVDEEDIAKVSTGQHVLIKSDAFEDKTFEGKITEITPKGDPVNKTFRVRVSLPEDVELLMGMTVEVNIIIQEIKDALLIPKATIHQGKVLVKTMSGIEEHEVQVGIDNEHFVQVVSGLTENDEILINPMGYLSR